MALLTTRNIISALGSVDDYLGDRKSLVYFLAMTYMLLYIPVDGIGGFLLHKTPKNLLAIIQYVGLLLLWYMWVFIGGTLINLPHREPVKLLMVILAPAIDLITLWMLVFNEGFQLPKNNERYLIVWHAKGILAITVARLTINSLYLIKLFLNWDQPYFQFFDVRIAAAVSVANAKCRP